MDFTEWNADPENVNTFVKVITYEAYFRLQQCCKCLWCYS